MIKSYPPGVFVVLNFEADTLDATKTVDGFVDVTGWCADCTKKRKLIIE